MTTLDEIIALADDDWQRAEFIAAVERLIAERDALRALLKEALPFVVSEQTFDGHTTETPSGLLARIDAALNG